MRWTRSWPGRAACRQAAILAATAWLWLHVVPSAAQSPQPPPRFVVALDAAHGGDDTGGKLEDNQLEKSFTLAFSVRLRSLLGARGIQVVTTREQDIAVDADHRAAVANHAGAEACLILHASESGQGVHLYVSSVAPVQARGFVAWKTAQAAFLDRSVRLAGVLNSALSHASITVLAGRVGLPGLDSMSCPAVAVEIAPETMTSRSGSNGALDDPDYQARVAGALAGALLEWRTEGHQP
jgi:N-acetylmuramoyl-L-alanine amidase